MHKSVLKNIHIHGIKSYLAIPSSGELEIFIGELSFSFENLRGRYIALLIHPWFQKVFTSPKAKNIVISIYAYRIE